MPKGERRELNATPFRLLVLSLLQGGLILFAMSAVVEFWPRNLPGALAALGAAMIVEALLLVVAAAWLKEKLRV